MLRSLSDELSALVPAVTVRVVRVVFVTDQDFIHYLFAIVVFEFAMVLALVIAIMVRG